MISNKTSFFAVLVTLAACSDSASVNQTSDAGADASTTTPSTVRFAPADEAMEFGRVPFPNELYRDSERTIRLAPFASEPGAPDPTYYAALRDSLAELDGFSPVAPIFFGVDGDVDPQSLPSSSAESLAASASAFVVSVDVSAQDAFQRTPASVAWDEQNGFLVLRPADGYPLTPGMAYAAVVTSAVRDVDGDALLPSEDFLAIRDRTVAPTDARLLPAYTSLSPVLASLASNGVARESVVGLAVFRVQTVATDLADARTAVRATPPVADDIVAVRSGEQLDARLGVPEEAVAGIDIEGGVLHSHVGWMIHGTLPMKNFESADRMHHGHFERTEGGALEVKRTDDVPFTLWLPSAGDLSDLRVIVFQHGLGGHRGDALGLVDACNEAGWAVLAIDAPFHGMRVISNTPDVRNGYAGTSEPDGFGDASGTEVVVGFAGLADDGGELAAAHPFYLRDAIRQSAVDLMSAVAALDSSDSWAAVRSADPALETLGFSPEPLAFVGQSLGGIIGTVFVASESRIGAAHLNVTGGSLTKLVGHSANFSLFLGILAQRFGLSVRPGFASESVDTPELTLWQTLADRGDSMSFARALRETPTHILLQMAIEDEAVPNLATESLARVLGASIAGAASRFVSLADATLPLDANFELPNSTTRATRVLVAFTPASHGMLLSRNGAENFEHPVAPPFVPLAAPTTFTNPIDASQDQTIHFFETWANTGRAEVR
jgi:hypothetical protein